MQFRVNNEPDKTVRCAVDDTGRGDSIREYILKRWVEQPRGGDQDAKATVQMCI